MIEGRVRRSGVDPAAHRQRMCGMEEPKNPKLTKRHKAGLPTHRAVGPIGGGTRRVPGLQWNTRGLTLPISIASPNPRRRLIGSPAGAVADWWSVKPRHLVEAPHRQLCFKHVTPMPAHPETPMIGIFRRTPAVSSIELRPGLNWRRQVSPDFGARRRPSNEHEKMLSKPLLKSLLEVVPCDRCQATGARRQVPIQFSFNSIQF